jgi:hypothetical protein
MLILSVPLLLEEAVLEVVCYLLALIFSALAVLSPLPAAVDRLQLLCAAFVCFVIPPLVHAIHAA